MRMRSVRLAVISLVVAGLAVSSASASGTAHRASPFLVGINDEAFTLYGDPVSAFDTLTTLRAQVLRVNLYWGGTKWAVANKKPAVATNPGDKAYDWSLYDRLVRYASDANVKLVFSILFTPSWANHGAGRTRAPTSFKALQDFAHAAAIRYSGSFSPPVWQQDSTLGGAATLPKVSMWTAWNEPNNPIWLSPQYTRAGKTWRIQSAYNYARICNAVYAGIHAVPNAGKVACGVTGPKGNDAPRTSRPSVDALTFLSAAHRYGMKRFDVYAHHPYATAGNEAPRYVPTGKAKRRVQMGNINLLLAEITRFYGPKHLWITEYGYQTNPPDRTIEGTSWAKQALYLKQAFAMARSNPRIDMMLWFLVRDQPNIGGWQSGLETITGVHKPAWAAFQELPR
jgi:Glycosyl hydrolase catalytic core